MIKLIVGNLENLNGYKKIGITKDLSEIDDGECLEIRGIDICNYLHITEIEKYVSGLCKKTITWRYYIYRWIRYMASTK